MHPRENSPRSIKNMPLDYTNYLEKDESSVSEQEDQVPQKKKGFSLAGLKEYWSLADKKMKIEIMVFLAIIAIIIGILISYSIFKSKEKIIILPPNYDEKMFFKQ